MDAPIFENSSDDDMVDPILPTISVDNVVAPNLLTIRDHDGGLLPPRMILPLQVITVVFSLSLL